ncbi:MAG: CBS domain-containing protein, partial [Thermoplasmata archaeon]|nr:CBS domain-containing protein [Thermoplasmata archaeon]
MSTLGPTAGEMMTPRPITVTHDAPLSQALGLMRSHAIHELPVLERKRLAGMVTFESIARRTNLPLATKVGHLMLLTPVVTANTTFVELAERLLAANMRAAPVVGKKGELIGIVSRTDMVRALPTMAGPSRRLVEEIQSPVSLMLRETDRCGRLLSHLRLLEEHPLPITDKRGKLVGAVGIADLGRVLWRPVQPGHKDAKGGGSVFDVEIGTVMHSPAVTVPRGTTAGDAAALMSKERISSVFILENGKPTGIVSQVDLLGLAVGGEPGERAVGDVYVQVHGLRGSGDPAILAEVDRLVARGLRHMGRHSHPVLLSLHVNPHSTHRTGDATVAARLHTDRGIYYASQTSWNFFTAVGEVMEELSGQIQKATDEQRQRRRRPGGRAPDSDEGASD